MSPTTFQMPPFSGERRKLREDGTQDDGLLFPCQLPQLSGDLVAYSRSSRIQSMDVVPHGTDVEFNCLNLGRAMKIGAGEARCLNGNWTAPPPVCAIPDRSSESYNGCYVFVVIEFRY